MKKTPVLIANAIIVVLTLAFVVLYIQKDDQSKILENTENFTSMSIGMELVTTNYLEGEQRLCDSWARYINHGFYTIEEATDYMKVVQAIKVPAFKKSKKKDQNPLQIEGLIPGMAMHFAGCCHPLPGDRIVGIVTTGKGVAVHTIDCKVLEKYSKEPERWLDISWGKMDETETYIGRLKIMLSNEPGSLGEISNIMARHNTNISNLNIVYRTVSYFEIMLDLDVKNVQQLDEIIASLKSCKAVSYVARAN